MTPLRDRLMNPPNAVPDTGIRMRNGQPVADASMPYRPHNVTVDPDIAALQVHKQAEKEARKALWHKAKSSLPDMLEQVAAGLGEPMVLLLGESRSPPLVWHRQAAAAVVYRLTGASTTRVGRMMNRDHTTIVNSIRKMAHHIDAVACEMPAGSPPIEWARAMRARIG